MSERVPACLSAKYITSYGYFIVKERLPVTVAKVIENLFKEMDEIGKTFGYTANEELKEIVGTLVKLKNEIQNNRPLMPLTVSAVDSDLWNRSLFEISSLMAPETPTWYSAPLLFVECYLYRRIFEAFKKSYRLKGYDYFEKYKTEALISSTEALIPLGQHLLSVVKEVDSEYRIRIHLSRMLKISLWGNRCDLSVSAGGENASDKNAVASIKSLEEQIISNDAELLVNYILETKFRKPLGIRVDIVVENGGYDLFCDLCLAHFLCTSKIARQIRFYVKRMPWFVNDATRSDFMSLLDAMKTISEPDRTVLDELSYAWRRYIRDSTWTIETEVFWTYPFAYSHMQKDDPNLYQKLSLSDLVIFKGDLNYRKLTGDRMWNYTTPFETALSGFNPSPLCALRVLKAETVVGLAAGQSEEIEKTKKDWLISGNFAVIQFSQTVS